MTDKPTPGPWRSIEVGSKRGTNGDPSYISIVGPNGEKICDIFPHAGVGGVGIDVARANARLICRASRDAALQEIGNG